MQEAVPLVVVTCGLIFCFSYFFISLQLEDIRHNWHSRRCEPFVIPIAQLVPDGSDPNVNPSDFAIDNFQFCMKELINGSLAIFTAPMLEIFRIQVEATKPIKNGINYLMANAKSLLDPINDMFNAFWQKIQIVIYFVARTYGKLASSFDRIFGIAISSIFAGIGLYQGIRNMLNFVIYVVILILTILLVIVIFAFFILAPVLPTIISVIAVIAASVFGGAVGGMAESFCVAKGTLVATAEGWRPVEELQPGDKLRDGVVEGVLKTSGVGAQCVVLKGVIISDTHLVLDSKDCAWKQAGQVADARPAAYQEELYCLNTSTRTWIVKGAGAGADELVLRDWEELPEGADAAWEEIVYGMLNRGPALPRARHLGRGLCGPETMIWTEGKGRIPITQVSIGDRVQDGFLSMTKVLGVYHDNSTKVARSGLSSPGWIWNFDERMWVHPYMHTEEPSFTQGYQLITQSGMFMIGYEDIIRDFTEVGASSIDQTYEYVLQLLASR